MSTGSPSLTRTATVGTDPDIYWHDPDTLFISLHQDGRTLYPGSGFPEEVGGPMAAGTTLNVPCPLHIGRRFCM
ncbi:MAG: hypothetical protein R2875_03240 [Desulfobacterales bacterium]